LKKQRDQKIALAFGNSNDFNKNKDKFQFEYYPEDTLEFAREHIKFA
jgi:hypothetical protein